MAIVIIGRGIDLSMIATLAVPAGLILQMVQNGHSVFAAFAAAAVLAVAFGLINGWLVAYAEVPSLFTTLASGLFLAGMARRSSSSSMSSNGARNLTRSHGSAAERCWACLCRSSCSPWQRSGSPSSCGAPALAPTCRRSAIIRSVREPRAFPRGRSSFCSTFWRH